MNDKLAVVGALATEIIHEINNPMAWISSNLESLKTRIQGLHKHNLIPLDELNEFDQITTEALLGTEKIKKIISDLKGFARADQDELALVDIDNILTSTINLIAPQCKKSTKLMYMAADQLPLLMLNEGKLQQVFLNLIVNASQSFNNDDIDKNRVRIQTHVDKNYVYIDIGDNGKGVPPENIAKVFDPFFTTKAVGVGTGLGLSICHERVQQLGGDILLESKVDQGSTFTVRFPLQLEQSISEAGTNLESSISKKILLVDDEPIMLAVMQRILGNKHKLTLASSGREALLLLMKNPEQFDLVISDLNMPDVNGADLFRYLAKNHSGIEKRLIFITGGSYSPIMDEFLSKNKISFIEKPFSNDQLINAINRNYES